MRTSFFISLALTPFLGVSLAAPSTLNTRTNCIASPCKIYNALLEYCSENYNENVVTGETIGPAAIKCMCGHLGIESITQPEVTSVEGWEGVFECEACGHTTGKNALALLDAWTITCNTWKNVGVQAAVSCWNRDQDCDTSGKK